MTGDEAPQTKSRIRQATSFDASLLAALHKACFDNAEGEAWSDSAMTQFIVSPSTVTLLATIGPNSAEPIGFVIARKAADEAELLTIGVLADYRKTGFGGSLLRQAMLDLKAAGARALYLEVDDTNHPALALYRRHGASVVGSRPGYYENGSNAAILQVDLKYCPDGPSI